MRPRRLPWPSIVCVLLATAAAVAVMRDRANLTPTVENALPAAAPAVPDRFALPGGSGAVVALKPDAGRVHRLVPGRQPDRSFARGG